MVTIRAQGTHLRKAGIKRPPKIRLRRAPLIAHETRLDFFGGPNFWWGNFSVARATSKNVAGVTCDP